MKFTGPLLSLRNGPQNVYVQTQSRYANGALRLKTAAHVSATLHRRSSKVTWVYKHNQTETYATRQTTMHGSSEGFLKGVQQKQGTTVGRGAASRTDDTPLGIVWFSPDRKAQHWHQPICAAQTYRTTKHRVSTYGSNDAR